MIKISDFGVSKQAIGGTNLQTQVGTYGYLAPEILSTFSAETSTYTSAADIWSLGCLVHTLITGEPPFGGMSQLLDYVKDRSPFPTAKMIGKKASQAAMNFIASLMWAHPEDRVAAGEALKDPWLAVRAETGGETIWTKIPNDMTRGLESSDSGLGQSQSTSSGRYPDLIA